MLSGVRISMLRTCVVRLVTHGQCCCLGDPQSLGLVIVIALKPILEGPLDKAAALG